MNKFNNSLNVSYLTIPFIFLEIIPFICFNSMSRLMSCVCLQFVIVVFLIILTILKVFVRKVLILNKILTSIGF